MTDKQIIIDKYPDCEYYNFSLGGICDQTTLSGNGKNCAKCSDIDGCFIKELYKQLKRKEQECEELKEEIKTNGFGHFNIEMAEQLDKLKKENEKMSKGYAELTEIVSPYIDDFTGYNEKLGGFNIVLCVKELLQQIDQLKVELEQEKALKETYLTCYKAKHEDIEGVLFKLKQTLTDIKEIAKNFIKNVSDRCVETTPMYGVHKRILQKISECEVENAKN